MTGARDIAAGCMFQETGRTLPLLLLTLSLLAGPLAAADQTLTPIPQTPQAPAFDLMGPDGERYRLEDMVGKPIIVNFWATWCPPCRAEMPSMQRAWEDLADEDILLIGINVGEDEGTVNDFLERVPVSFPLPLDKDSKVTQSWPLRGLPTTFIVDPDGRLVYKAAGEREWDDPALLDQVRALK
jgi:thiol-disulfide isomerase/thioredoxin